MKRSSSTSNGSNNLLIGERTAEEVKIKLGSAFPLDEEITLEIKGRDLVEGVPKTIVVSDEEIRESLAEAVDTIIDEWVNFDALAEIDIRPSKTCLIYGVPGTGKTRLALWIAKQLDLPVVLVKLDGLVSSFLGTTARNIGNLFTFARILACPAVR